MKNPKPFFGTASATSRSLLATRFISCLGAAALVSPSLADVLIDYTFDGIANDIGPDFQEVSNSTGTGGSSDLATGVITTSDASNGTWGFNNVATVDVLALDPAAVGFKATFEVSSTTLAGSIVDLTTNGMFFGVVSGLSATGTGGTSLWNNDPDAFGYTPGSGSYTDHAMRQDGDTDFPVPTPPPSDASFADGFTISFSVFSDETFTVTSTGLVPELVASGTLNALDFTYADIINDLGLFVSLQGEAFGQLDMDRMTLESLDTVPGDTLPPYIVALNPGGVSGVAVDSNLVATFSENIALKAGGSVTLTDLDDGSGTTVIALPDARVSVSGADLTINPSSDLEAANYEVTIGGLSVEDAAGSPNDFYGTVDGQWAFSTFFIPPAVVVKEVAGDGVIGDEVLATDGGVVTLDTTIGSNFRAYGGNGGGDPNAFSSLITPTINVPTTGPVTLTFRHRHNFEADWDGGAIFISVNGAPATYLAPGAFTQNGYTGSVNDNVWKPGEDVFHGLSDGFNFPTLITSVADLGSLTAGDTISVDFRGGWDDFTFPAGVNWEIGSVLIEDSVSTPILDVDFATDGTEDFTVTTTAVNPNFPGGWEYAQALHTFEIDADSLTTDRYAPDIPGSVIDLDGADIAVKLAAGTLNAGDEWVLFDLSGGTTLTGSIGSLTLPPGIWDSSTLAVDGRLILLLPPVAASLATPGADLFIDASQDIDTGDGRGPDFAVGNPTGFDLVLDTANGVTQTSVTSVGAPQIKSAYDMPGGFTGNNGGAHMSTAGAANNQRSFQEAPGDWTNENMTFEIWFKPDSLTPQAGTNTNGQILFEDGGGTGLGFFLDDSGEIQMRKAPNAGLIAYDLGADSSALLLGAATAEFIQVTGTYDVSSGAMEMFVNGTSVGTATAAGTDWSGGDGAGIGTRGDANTGGIGGGQSSTETLDGQVAIFRVYRDQILTQPEIAANFTDVTLADTRPPTYISLSPTNLSTGVFFENSLVATFTESIALTGIGSVTLREVGGSDLVIALPDPRVTVSGNELTIDPSPVLAYATQYAVLISPDAIVDGAAIPNAFAGMTDDTRWRFTTDPQDLDDPVITTLSPADGTTGVQALDSLVVTFDETVVISAAGDVTLKNLTDTTELPISLADASQVSLVGNVLTINPAATLRSNTDYAVRISGGALADISGNTFGGIPDDMIWNFSTGDYENILFSDTFERPDDVDLNASAAGKSGTLGILNWGSGNLQSQIDINGGAMRIDNNDSDGNDGSWAWVDQNFTGLESMTISLDIAQQSSGGDGRLTGFRMGQTLADISGETDAATSNNAADVAVYLDNIGGTRGIRVFEGTGGPGYVVTTNPIGVGVLSATFTFADMNAGTTLNYEIFLNGVSQYVGSTTWSGTDENYVSVQSNTTNATLFESITVTGSPFTGGPDYLAWSGLFPGADLGDPNGDFDGDGLSNDYERLFGLDPTNGSSVDPITVPLDATAGTLSFTRRDNALTGKFTHIETSFDLLTWTEDFGAILAEGTPGGNGVEVVDVTLSPGLLGFTRLFVRVIQNDDGTLFIEDFEGNDGGYTTTGTPNDWEWGTPNSNNNFGLVITGGNGGSSNCWATKLGAGEGPPAGVIDPAADSILRSPDIDLTGVAGAEFGFAAAIDANIGDVVQVLVRDAGTDALLETILPLGESPLSAIQSINWMSYGPFDLSVGAGSTVYLEFRYAGTDGTFIGFYLDDVSVIEVIPAP